MERHLVHAFIDQRAQLPDAAHLLWCDHRLGALARDELLLHLLKSVPPLIEFDESIETRIRFVHRIGLDEVCQQGRLLGDRVAVSERGFGSVSN